MSALTRILLILGAAAALAALPSPAQAATCGSTDPETGEVLRGALTLDEKSTVTDAVLKRSTGHRTISLIFTVSGCELPADAGPPTFTVDPRRGTDEIPAAAVAVKRVTPDRTTLDYLLDVDGEEFGPGAYGALIVLRADYITTTRSGITVSRSEDQFLIPVGVGALAAVVGFGLFYLLQFFRGSRPAVRLRWVFVVGGIAAGVGAVAVGVNYLDQDVWTFAENGPAAAVTGFTGATSGVMAGLLGGMWGSVEAREPAPARSRWTRRPRGEEALSELN